MALLVRYHCCAGGRKQENALFKCHSLVYHSLPVLLGIFSSIISVPTPDHHRPKCSTQHLQSIISEECVCTKNQCISGVPLNSPLCLFYTIGLITEAFWTSHQPSVPLLDHRASWLLLFDCYETYWQHTGVYYLTATQEMMEHCI